MTLVKITQDNLEQAVETALQIFPEEIHDDGFWPEKAYKSSIRCENEEFSYYIVYHNYEIVGITGHYISYDKIWLGWFGVKRKFRKHGLGKDILKATADIAYSFGYYKLSLYTSAKTEYVHRFYENNGFEEYRRGYVDGLPVVYFSADLPLS